MGAEADLRGMIGTLLPEARDVRKVGPSALLKTSCSILGISYHVGTMSIWQYSGHIVTEAKQMEAEADLRGTIGMVLPEAREQSEHVGAGTALPNDKHCQGGTILDDMQLRTEALAKTLIQ